MIIDFLPPVSMSEASQYNNSSQYDSLSNHGWYANQSTNEEDTYPIIYQFDLGYRVRTILSLPQNVIALILGTIAIGANVLSIIAICRLCRSKLTSHFRFILSLAVSDSLVGVSLLLFIFINASVELYPIGLGPEDKRLLSRCLYNFSKALNSTGLAITLLNLLGMAIDHYIAILRPLHYSVILNTERSNCMIISLWIIATIFGFSDFLISYPRYSVHSQKFNYCEFVHLTKYNEEYAIFVTAFICLVIMLIIYVRIYINVRRRKLRTGRASHELIKNKKAIVTTLLILGTFIICWLPLCLFTVALVIQVSVDPDSVKNNLATLYKVDSYLFNLLLLNAIADPIIYAARVNDIKNAWKCLCYQRKELRRQSKMSYELSQNTTFTDLIRTDSKCSNSAMEKKYINQCTMPMMSYSQITIIKPE